FLGRSLIFNRSTTLHIDDKDPKGNLTPILTVGRYTTGTLHIPELGLKAAYNSGTLGMLRGALLAHEVTFDGGQRVAVAHFMHTSMLRDIGAGAPPLTSVLD
ncbi:hypothetical protein EXIGLDRAFT_597112, partial [Exidia glandulosa HHB12029]